MLASRFTIRRPTMKHRFAVTLSVLAACALATPIVRAADQSDSPATVVPMITSSQFVVTGEVIARTEIDFTVLTRDSQLVRIQVNRDTSITKGAESLRLAELMVGDKVDVTLMRAGDGSLQATYVAVRTGYE